MRPRAALLVPGLLLGSFLLVACLGETSLPTLEAVPAPTLGAPSVDPTVAAMPRLSLGSFQQPPASNQPIPQIPHDLIGRSDCLMCHKQGVSSAPRVPDSHRGLESSLCQNCHTAPASTELSGAEMYTRVCAHCHGENGQGVFGPALNVKAYLQATTDAELRAAIVRGQGASEMLAWGDLGLLTDRQVEEIVAMIRAWEPTAPERSASVITHAVNAAYGDLAAGQALFARFCSGCHGLTGETQAGRGFILRVAVGSLDDATIARQISDGSLGMPPFHAMLTTDDINDLLALIRTWAAGPPTVSAVSFSGDEVYSRVCARCHGEAGEGGIGPPLNSKEFLSANNDEAIRQWVRRGTLGTSMLSWGDLGLLTPLQIDQLVAFIRAWEPTAPSRLSAQSTDGPPSAALGRSAEGKRLFAQFCSGCHGVIGERPTGGIVLGSEEFLSSVNDEIIASQIHNGGRKMPSFHAVLTTQQLNDLLAFLRAGLAGKSAPPSVPSFSADVLPILSKKCAACHGTAGGWSAATYDKVLKSGVHAPVIKPGDPSASLLVQRLQGTTASGGRMPPGTPLPAAEIDLIVNWILAGAPDN